MTLEAKPVVERKKATQEDLNRHVKGRIAYGDKRRLRYEAGWDIALATAQILREFVADCESPFFVCDHTEDLAAVNELLMELDRGTQSGDFDELPSLADWLKRVAALIPQLWD